MSTLTLASYVNIILLLPLFYIEGIGGPRSSLAFHSDPCIRDHDEPPVTPQSEQMYHGYLQSIEKFVALSEDRAVGYIVVAGQRFRVCIPMTRLLRQDKDATQKDIKHSGLKKDRYVEVRYIHNKKTTTNISTMVTDFDMPKGYRVTIVPYEGQIKSIRVGSVDLASGSSEGSLVLRNLSGDEVNLAIKPGTRLKRGDEFVTLDELSVGSDVKVETVQIPGQELKQITVLDAP
jgi:hypothetical protein